MAFSVFTAYCGPDVAVGLAQLLPQALCQRRHRVLGAAVEMHVRAGYNAMSTHTKTGEGGVTAWYFYNVTSITSEGNYTCLC